MNARARLQLRKARRLLAKHGKPEQPRSVGSALIDVTRALTSLAVVLAPVLVEALATLPKAPSEEPDGCDKGAAPAAGVESLDEGLVPPLRSGA